MPFSKLRVVNPQLFTLVVFCACSSASADKKYSSDSTVLQAAEVLTVVQTVVCENKPFIYSLKCDGKIKAGREETWIAEGTRNVVSFSGYNGRRYVKGEIIAVLDQSEIRMKLERAQLVRFNSSRDYESQLLGYAALLEGKNENERDSIKYKLRIASGLALAEQDIKEATDLLSRSVIKAPFSGVLAAVKVKKGGLVSQGDALFTLYTDRDLFMETEVLETKVHLLKPGIMADVFPVADLKSMVTAKVENIDPYVNERGMVAVLLQILKAPAYGMLFPGMHCSALLKISMNDGIVIPKTALVKRNDKPVVFTDLNGEAKWNDVVVGNDNGEEIEILKGLSAGDKVIITNNTQLAHQSPVKEGHD